jgi:glycosyltransferase involved in cell wall biosynthesis
VVEPRFSTTRSLSIFGDMGLDASHRDTSDARHNASSWPKLTVVLAVRNGLPELHAQLDALIGQSYPGTWEIVAVDDGSTDRSRAVLEESLAGLPGGRVIDGPELGLGAARLAGAQAARGDALVFVDHDDVVAPNYLREMGAALRDHPIVAARVDVDLLNPTWLRASRPPQQTEGLPVDYWPFGSGGTLGVRHDIYDALGGHDPLCSGPEDRDLCFRAAQAGFVLAFAPDAVLRYRYRSAVGAILRQARRGGRGDAWLYRRHRSHGYPPRSAKVDVVKWWRGIAMLVAGIAHRDRTARAGAVHRLGRLLGHIEGCFIERVRYLQWNVER